MSERLTKFILMLFVAPILAVVMLVVAVLMLLLPVVALIAPEVIDTRGKDE